jgi:hypothetical protein
VLNVIDLDCVKSKNKDAYQLLRKNNCQVSSLRHDKLTDPWGQQGNQSNQNDDDDRKLCLTITMIHNVCCVLKEEMQIKKEYTLFNICKNRVN